MSKDWFQSNFGESTSNLGPTTKKSPRKSLTRNKSFLNSQTKSSGELTRSQSKRKVSEDDALIIEEDKVDEKLNEKLKKFQAIDWLRAFQPKNVSEIAIHPKKLDELKGWFSTSCAKVPNKILLLEGPTGCSKTTALKLVAKESGYDVCEWTNSTDLETDLLRENVTDFNRDFVSYENQVQKFSDFLFRSSRFQSIFSSDKRLILVKDLPNTFLKKTDEFMNILKRYSEEGMSPLVFVVTETNAKSLNIGFNLFSDKLRNELCIESINFNPIASTLMKRGLKKIIQLIESNNSFKSCFKKPTEEVMDSIIDQSQGDIRNAILNLNFASQQSNIALSLPKAFKKTGKKQKSSQKDVGLGKCEVLSLMHGLGRVFYPKKEMNLDTNILEFTHKPENIAECFSSQPTNFIQMISSNYISKFGDIHDLAEASEILSLANCFESEYRDPQLNQLTLNMVIRSTMVHNIHPPVGFKPVSAYASKKWKNAEEKSQEKFKNASKHVNNGHIMGRNDFFCDYNVFSSKLRVNFV